MTRNETKQLLMRIQSVYPNWKPQAELRFVVETWHEYLLEYPYEQVKMALKAYILSDNKGFAPSIGELVSKMHNISAPKELNEMEAWALVSKALKNGTYGAEEEFAKLPPVVQSAVGHPSNLRNWAQTDMESIENVIQSNFIKTYRIAVQRSQELMKMPTEVRRLIESVNQGQGIEIKPLVQLEEIKQEHQSEPMPDSAKERLKELFGLDV